MNNIDKEYNLKNESKHKLSVAFGNSSYGSYTEETVFFAYK